MGPSRPPRPSGNPGHGLPGSREPRPTVTAPDDRPDDLSPAGSRFRERLLDHLADGVYFVDRHRTITYWNRGAERLTGYAAADVVGHRCHDNLLQHVDADGVGLCEGRCPLVAAVGDGQDHEAQVWLRHADGSRRPVRVRTSPILDGDGRVTGAVEVFDDATELVTARQRADSAQRDALMDGLTGIPNRRFLEMMLGARAEDLQRYGTPFTVLMADVDHFKRVNDGYGHATGDEALRVVAETIRGGVREGDFAGRWGGEEFLVIAQHTEAEDALALAERLRLLVASSAVRTPGGPIAVTVSIGAAVARPAEPAADVVARADGALYAAKGAGRNAVVLAPAREAS